MKEADERTLKEAEAAARQQEQDWVAQQQAELRMQQEAEMNAAADVAAQEGLKKEQARSDLAAKGDCFISFFSPPFAGSSGDTGEGEVGEGSGAALGGGDGEVS